MDAKSDRRVPRLAPPTSVGGAVSRFGWSTRQLAQAMGISERTARRWRQQDRVPPRRAAAWSETTAREQGKRNDAARDAEGERRRKSIERRGLSRMNVSGTYRISNSRYQARKDFPVRFVTGKITGAQMREVFAAADRGDDDEAEELLNEALAEAYGAPGLYFEDVDGIDFA
jgi:hypothetical protein